MPSGHSPGRIQIVRGRWEAAERQLEPWWAVCHPAHHPLFPLWPGFLLPCSHHSLEVPQNMYPLENIYNFLTSWEFCFFFSTPGAANDKTLPRSLLSELNYVFALMLFIFGLLIYFFSLGEIFTKQGKQASPEYFLPERFVRLESRFIDLV